MLEQTVYKPIPDFAAYADKQHTSFASIQKAYAAANAAADLASAAGQEPYLVRSSIGPTVQL